MKCAYGKWDIWISTKYWRTNFLFQIFLDFIFILVNSFFFVLTFDKLRFFSIPTISTIDIIKIENESKIQNLIEIADIIIFVHLTICFQTYSMIFYLSVLFVISDKRTFLMSKGVVKNLKF